MANKSSRVFARNEKKKKKISRLVTRVRAWHCEIISRSFWGDERSCFAFFIRVILGRREALKRMETEINVKRRISPTCFFFFFCQRVDNSWIIVEKGGGMREKVTNFEKKSPKEEFYKFVKKCDFYKNYQNLVEFEKSLEFRWILQ